MGVLATESGRVQNTFRLVHDLGEIVTSLAALDEGAPLEDSCVEKTPQFVSLSHADRIRKEVHDFIGWQFQINCHLLSL